MKGEKPKRKTHRKAIKQSSAESSSSWVVNATTTI